MREPSIYQAKAIAHVNGPAELIAGPGSGKTFTITRRINSLILNEHIDPDDILVVTFSKAAANEMKTRFESTSDECGVHFGTFHSLAYFILRESFGLKSTLVLSEGEKKNILLRIFKRMGKGGLVNNEILGDIISKISKIKNSSEYDRPSLESDMEGISTELLNRIISEYFVLLKELNKIDFDDMILEALKRLKGNEKKLNEYRERFKYILVDEFQDINVPQYELIKLLAFPRNNIFVVGDDDQSIYKFRGSAPQSFRMFLEDFPGATVIKLLDNYRSGKNIVSFASRVIEKNKDRFSKEFNPVNEGGKVSFSLITTYKEEMEEVCNLLHNMDQKELSDTAIISRTNREIAAIRGILLKSNIKIAGSKEKEKNLFDSFILEDITAFFRFIYEGRKREDFLKFMNKPQKYIERAALNYDVVNKDDLLKYYQCDPEMQHTLNEFFKKLDLASRLKSELSLSMFIKTIGYEKYLKTISRDAGELKEFYYLLNEAENLFSEYKRNESVTEFIERASLSEKRTDDKNKQTGEGLKLMTMHGSKGLEFKNVILTDVNEGVIPGKNIKKEELEEERRLLYVAITRAKENLYIYATKERNREVSRFIKGII